MSYCTHCVLRCACADSVSLRFHDITVTQQPNTGALSHPWLICKLCLLLLMLLLLWCLATLLLFYMLILFG